ncbi:MAG: dihydroxy-acid dehydratase, partial [Chthoniobacterales bacterium]
VKDMVRISDARMSGTAFGTIVLHVTPDAASGGPLALAQTGDRIRLSVRERRLDLLVGETELERRRSLLPGSPAPSSTRGYSWLYDNFITQANEGCDFAFLKKNGWLAPKHQSDSSYR